MAWRSNARSCEPPCVALLLPGDDPEDRGRMTVDWYSRRGVDPWQMSACDAHGAELVELGFARGVIGADLAAIGAAHRCVFCDQSTTLDEVRACRCHVLGTPCLVHRPKPAGAAGAWSRVRCTKCGAELQLPADRIAFEGSAGLGLVVAVDVTGWARRNGGGDELCCPFHGEARYPLEYVSGPGRVDEFGEDDDELGDDELGDDDELTDDEQLH